MLIVSRPTLLALLPCSQSAQSLLQTISLIIRACCLLEAYPESRVGNFIAPKEEFKWREVSISEAWMALGPMQEGMALYREEKGNKTSTKIDMNWPESESNRC